MNIDKFKFYAVLKNEDAMPYIYTDDNRGFIVAADGLGGSGSFVHQLSKEETSKLRSLLDSMLPEYDLEHCPDKEFRDWIDNLITPMQDGEPDTSALWGSRVVIANLAFYLRAYPSANLADEDVRSKIVNYIYRGMEKVKDEFKLKTGNLSGQLTLPTTLVGVKYAINPDNSIHTDVFWAGDSRAYALIPGQGLKQLSQDDEDNSGAIVNLFAFKQDDRIQTKLNYKSYTLPAKSCIFVCSDGFFDPYDPIDNLGVEAVLLDCLQNATSFDDFSKKWYENYEPIRQDDCTVAFLAFGLDSFDELKKMYGERANKIVQVFKDYNTSKKVIPIIKGEQDDPEASIISRAASRKSEIANRIAAECMANPRSSDITVTQTIRGIAARLKEECRERSDAKIKVKKKEIVEKLVQDLLDSPLNIERIFNTQTGMLRSLEPLTIAATDINAKQSICAYAQNRMEEVRADCTRIVRHRDILKAAILNRRNEIEQAKIKIEQFLSLCDELYSWSKNNSGSSDSQDKLQKVNFQYQRELNMANSAVKALSELISDVDNNNKISQKYADKVYSRDRKELIDAAQKLYIKHGENLNAVKEAENQVKAALASLDQSKDTYQKKVRFFAQQNMDFYIEHPDENFTEQIAANINEQCLAEVEVLTVEMLAREIERYFNSDSAAFDKIISDFMKPEATTVIDSVFNTSRLLMCRTFKNYDQEKVKQLIVTVDELSAAYEDYPATPTVPTGAGGAAGAGNPSAPPSKTDAGSPTDPAGD